MLASLDASSLGVEVVRAAGVLLSARHGAQRVAGAWASLGSAEAEAQHTALCSSERTRAAAVRAALDEYMSSGRSAIAVDARCSA